MKIKYSNVTFFIQKKIIFRLFFYEFLSWISSPSFGGFGAFLENGFLVGLSNFTKNYARNLEKNLDSVAP